MAKDSAAKKQWDLDNTMMVSVKFQKKKDGDIIDYLTSHESAENPKTQIIRAALREYIANHK